MTEAVTKKGSAAIQQVKDNKYLAVVFLVVGIFFGNIDRFSEYLVPSLKSTFATKEDVKEMQEDIEDKIQKVEDRLYEIERKLN